MESPVMMFIENIFLFYHLIQDFKYLLLNKKNDFSPDYQLF